MTKVLYCMFLGLLIPIGVAALSLALWWLTTDGSASVNIWNRSHTNLDSVVVTVSDRSAKFNHIEPGQDAAFGVDPRLTFHFNVDFDADGTHHHSSAQTYALPFGDSIVSVSVDDQLHVTASSKPTFLYR